MQTVRSTPSSLRFLQTALVPQPGSAAVRSHSREHSSGSELSVRTVLHCKAVPDETAGQSLDAVQYLPTPTSLPTLFVKPHSVATALLFGAAGLLLHATAKETMKAGFRRFRNKLRD